MKFDSTALNRAASMAVLHVKKASPTLLLVAGIGGVITGTVMACKATKKAEPVIDDFIHETEAIRETKETNENYGKDLTMAYCRGICNIGKLYLPTIAIETVSIGCLVASHNIQSTRLAGLSAAYTAVGNAYNSLQEKLKAENPEMHEKLVYGVEDKVITEDVVDPKGKIKSVSKTVKIANPDELVSPYARYFNCDNPNWDENPMLNLDFIMKQQKTANRMLKDRGYLFLNEVYRMLGFAITDYGQKVGWIYCPNATDDKHKEAHEDAWKTVSFGIYGISMTDGSYFPTNALNQQFVNGDSNVALLDFNTDGYILDLI
jgi:hypothetical protein